MLDSKGKMREEVGFRDMEYLSYFSIHSKVFFSGYISDDDAVQIIRETNYLSFIGVGSWEFEIQARGG